MFESVPGRCSITSWIGSRRRTTSPPILGTDPDPEIVCDWPEDIALFCRLIQTSDGQIVDLSNLRFHFLRTPGFSTARNSQVPTNGLHDARALRDFVIGQRTVKPPPFEGGELTSYCGTTVTARRFWRPAILVRASRDRTFLAVADHADARGVDAGIDQDSSSPSWRGDRPARDYIRACRARRNGPRS